jgi:uncharacterized iron-regulated membrane protein
MSVEWLHVAQVLQHLGPLHAWEQALTYVLAFAPFAVLGFVVWWRRRQDAVEGEESTHVSDRRATPDPRRSRP